MKDVSDWSELPNDLYVTSVARDNVVFWVEACSVPMVIGPELRLIRADMQSARIAALEAALREAEGFMAYFAGETGGSFSGSGTPQSCLVTIRAALAAKT